MSFNINLQEQDTKSLLDLANHTNPNTIGELLTYDKIDIQNFNSTYKPIDDTSDLIIAQRISDGQNFMLFDIADAAAYTEIYVQGITSRLNEVDNSFFNGWISTPYGGKVVNDNIIRYYNRDYINANYYTGKLYGPLTYIIPNTEYECELKVNSGTIYKHGIGFKRSDDTELSFDVVIAPNEARLLIYDSQNHYQLNYDFYYRISDIGFNPDEPVNFKIKVNSGSISIYVHDRYIITHTPYSPQRIDYKYNKVFFITNARDDTELKILKYPGFVKKYGSLTPIAGWKFGYVKDLIASNRYPSNITKIGRAKGDPTYATARLVNREYVKDTVDIEYYRIAINDLIYIEPSNQLWDWYDSDEWNDSRDIPLAIQFFRDVLENIGVDVDKNTKNIQVTRIQDGGSWYLQYTFESLTLADGTSAKIKMPHNFSDSVTVKDLNGFIYSPIPETSVVF